MSLWAGVESAVPHEETLLVSRAVGGTEADTGRRACEFMLPTSREGSERPRLFDEEFVRPGAVHDIRTEPIGVEDGREIELSPRCEYNEPAPLLCGASWYPGMEAVPAIGGAIP